MVVGGGGLTVPGSTTLTPSTKASIHLITTTPSTSRGARTAVVGDSLPHTHTLSLPLLSPRHGVRAVGGGGPRRSPRRRPRGLVGPTMAYSYLNDDPAELAEVLSRDIPWETYLTARLITDKDLQLIKRYDKRADDLRASMLDEVGGVGAGDRRRGRGRRRAHAASGWMCGKGLRGGGVIVQREDCGGWWGVVHPPPSCAHASTPGAHGAAQAGAAYVEAFLSVLKNVTKEETVQYVLALLLKLVQGGCGRVSARRVARLRLHWGQGSGALLGIVVPRMGAMIDWLHGLRHASEEPRRPGAVRHAC